MALEMQMEQVKQTKGTAVFRETIRNGEELPEDERAHTFYLLKQTHQDLLNGTNTIFVRIESK